jgi:hypothetical protein
MHRQYIITHQAFPSPHTMGIPIDRKPQGSFVKAILVDMLGFFLTWSPSFAMFLGKLISRVWHGFGRA